MENKTISETYTALYIPEQTQYWFVRAESKGKFYDDFQINNYVAVGSNDISLDDLLLIDKRYRVSRNLLENKYKEIFNSVYTNLLIKKYADQNKSTPRELLAKVKRSSSIAASNNFMFIETMQVGDIVIVPYDRSSKFLIGTVLSDVSEDDISHIHFSDEENRYEISDFHKKRRMLWIKEINNDDLPDKLKWIRYAHQSVFNISNYADMINPLLSSKYIYKEQFHSRIGVQTNNPIFDDEFYNFQKVTHDFKQPGDKIQQKTKVQSKGDFIQQISQVDWKTLVTITSVLVGNVKIPTFNGATLEVKGIIPALYGRFSSEGKLDNEAKKSKHKADIAQNKLAEYKASEELDKIKQQRQIVANQLAQGLQHESSIPAKNNDTNAKELSVDFETRESLNSMKLTDSSVGISISPEMQKDIVFESLEKLESTSEPEQQSQENLD